jgi:hypothetical protein
MSHTSTRSYPVQVEVDGTSYSGTYTVQGRIITVTLGTLERSRQLGGMAGEVLAMNLLREMVRETKA